MWFFWSLIETPCHPRGGKSRFIFLTFNFPPPPTLGMPPGYDLLSDPSPHRLFDGLVPFAFVKVVVSGGPPALEIMPAN